MNYKEKFYPGTREKLLEKVARQMSSKRFQHVLGVEKAAIQLAKRYDENLEKASVAALIHDYAKERGDEESIACIHANQLDTSIIPYGNNIWHGLVGAELAKEELHIKDEAILNAVRLHTTGGAVMCPLTKILYVADFIEEGRDFPEVAVARELAFKDLNQAVSFETKHTFAYLIAQEAKIYPKSIETYNAWVAKE